MSTIHYGLTISVRIRPGKRDTLEAVLNKIQDDGVAENDLFPFGQLSTTHFATWVIVPEEEAPNGRKLHEQLLLMTSYTGARAKHFDELAHVGLKGFHEAFLHCEGYQFQSSPSVDEMCRFLKKHAIRNTFYTGFQYITHEQAGQENQLREAIQGFLDQAWKNGTLADKSALETRSMIQQFVENQPELAWATKPYKRSFNDFLRLFGPLIVLGVILGGSLILSIIFIFTHTLVTTIGLAIFGGFLLTVSLLLVLLRINESNPHVDVAPPTDERIYEITSKEIYPVKNEMTVIGTLKKGFIRRVFLGFTLWLVPFFRAFSYIPTVHTARWLQIDGGRRLVFIAYFDNTSEGYAHDFVDSTKRTRNLNLIFGHGKGFPATKWAVGGGGKDRKRYITAVRASQKITQLWYSSHNTLGILNLNNNRDIRKGLFGDLDKAQVEEWLLKL
ncbi:MAG: peroxidase [Bacteroidota bacterium]